MIFLDFFIKYMLELMHNYVWSCFYVASGGLKAPCVECAVFLASSDLECSGLPSLYSSMAGHGQHITWIQSEYYSLLRHFLSHCLRLQLCYTVSCVWCLRQPLSAWPPGHTFSKHTYATNTHCLLPHYCLYCMSFATSSAYYALSCVYL